MNKSIDDLEDHLVQSRIAAYDVLAQAAARDEAIFARRRRRYEAEHADDVDINRAQGADKDSTNDH